MKTREEEKERATLSIISSIMQYKTERGGGGLFSDTKYNSNGY